MRLMTRILHLIMLVIFLSCGVYAGEIEDLVNNSPDPSRYPDANVLILSSEKTYELTDGKSLENTRYLVRILNNKGRGKYGDQKVPFNTDKDVLTLVKAGTYKKDARFVAIENKAVNDVTPAELEGAEVYANYLNRVFSFPVVDPGSVLLMHYQKTSRLEDDQNISDRVFLQSDEPMLDKKVTILVPPQKKLVYRMSGFDGSLKAEKTGDRISYTVEVHDVPMVKGEENMPPFPDVARNFLFSTCASWDEAAKPMSGKFFKACEVTPEITAMAGQLTQNCPTPEEKLRAISSFIVQKVRNVDVALGKVGYAPHRASEVLKNKYGECRDKSVLMITLLKSCGIDAYPALIADDALPIVKDVPTLKQFDNMLIAIPNGGGYRFLDPQGDMSQFGFVATELTSEALVIRPEGTLFSRVSGYSPIDSRAVNTVEGTLAENGSFAGKIRTQLFGIYDVSARSSLYALRAKMLTMFFEQKADEFCPEGTDRGSSRTDPLDLGRNMEVSLSVEAPGFAVTQGNLMVIKFPEIPFQFSRYSYAPSLPSRKYPYDLGTFSQNMCSYKIKIPAGCKPLYLPDSLDVKEVYGAFVLKCDYDADTSEIMFSKDLKFTRNRVSPEEYPLFKKTLERLALTQNNLVILKKQ